MEQSEDVKTTTAVWHCAKGPNWWHWRTASADRARKCSITNQRSNAPSEEAFLQKLEWKRNGKGDHADCYLDLSPFSAPEGNGKGDQADCYLDLSPFFAPPFFAPFSAPPLSPLPFLRFLRSSSPASKPARGEIASRRFQSSRGPFPIPRPEARSRALSSSRRARSRGQLACRGPCRFDE
jgi:hypothetical protein